MTRKGPLLTLLGGGVLAAVLMVSNLIAAQENGDDDGGRGVSAAGNTPTEAPPTGEPTPSEPAEDAEAEDPEPVTYVGYVDAGEASVAIVLNGEEATGYFCDGVNEAWLDGTAEDGELALAGDGAELTADYDGEQASGRVNLGGQALRFSLEQVDAPEGLYRFADTILGGAEVNGGWIVLPDGTQVGVVTVDGESRSAPALDPETGEVRLDGATVTTERVDD